MDKKKEDLIERAWMKYRLRYPAGFLRSELFKRDRQKEIKFAVFILKMVLNEFFQRLKTALKGRK